VPQLHQRGVDLLVDVLDTVDHIETFTHDDIRRLLKVGWGRDKSDTGDGCRIGAAEAQRDVTERSGGGAAMILFVTRQGAKPPYCQRTE
jgi:hypothetical protein